MGANYYYSLANVTLQAGKKDNMKGIRNGSYEFTDDINGNPVYTVSAEEGGMAVFSKRTKETLVGSMTVTTTIDTDSYHILSEFSKRKEGASKADDILNFYFSDGIYEIICENAVVNCPESMSYQAQAGQGTFTFLLNNYEKKKIGG